MFGSVRKPADKTRLEEKFPNNFRCLTFDVNDGAAIQREKENVERVLSGELLCCLVNNAGIAVAGPLQLLDDEVFESQFSANVFGARKVINAFLPLLGASLESATGSEAGENHQQQFDFRHLQYAAQWRLLCFQARDRKSR